LFLPLCGTGLPVALFGTRRLFRFAELVRLFRFAELVRLFRFAELVACSASRN